MKSKSIVWLGTEESLNDHLAKHEAGVPPEITTATMARMEMRRDEDDDYDEMDEIAEGMIEVHNSVGVLSISGSLVADESVYNPWFGEVAYPSISRALNMLLEEPSVKSIVLNIDSGGGDARGVSEAGYAIAAADSIKPVYAFGNVALSAAYWLGVSARKIFAGQMSELGSIGAVSAFVGVSRAMKENGLDVYVARSGPKKAVPNRMEPLTDAGKAVLDSTVAALGGFFADHVLRSRPNLSAADPKAIFSGEIFWGQKAAELGLCDGLLAGLAELVSMAETVHNPTLEIVQSQHPSFHSTGAPTQMAGRLVLSDLNAARLAMGLSTLGELPDVAPTSAQPAAQPAADAAPAPALEAADEGTPIKAVESATLAADESATLATYLKTEITDLKAENKALKASLEEAMSAKLLLESKASEVEQLRPVAEAAVTRLSIGLGHRSMKLEHVPSNMLAEQFQELQAELMALPAGRMTATPQVDTIEPEAEGPETLAQHRLRLVPHAR